MDLLQIAALGEKLGYSGAELKRYIDDEEKKMEQKEKQKLEREERLREREEAARAKEREEKELEWKRQEEEKEKAWKRKQEEKVLEHRQELERKEKELEILRAKATLSDKNEDRKFAEVSAPRPKLPKFDENEDDMDAFLERFERYAETQKWAKDSWAVSLSPLLTGKGLQVYTSMPAADINSYDKLKIALLRRYQLTADGFQKKFRENRPEAGESVFQYIARLSRYLQRWIELSGIAKTYDALHDLMIREQYLNTCNADLAIFIKERVPKSLAEMTELAEQYIGAHGREDTSDAKLQRPNRAAAAQGFQSSSAKQFATFPRRQTFGEKRCFICNKSNHIARDCFYRDSNKKQTEEAESESRQKGEHHRTNEGGQKESRQNTEQITGIEGNQHMDNRMPVCKGYLNAQEVDVLRDTGCSNAAVKKALVKAEQMTDKVSSCILIDGTERHFPVATLHVNTPYYTGKVDAMVMENPVYDMILGNIPGIRNHPDPEWNIACSVVVIRRAQEERRYKILKPTTVPSAKPYNLNTHNVRVKQENDRTLRGRRRTTEKCTMRRRGNGRSWQVIGEKGVPWRTVHPNTTDRRDPSRETKQLMVPWKYRKHWSI
jgi:hypothetical protein